MAHPRIFFEPGTLIQGSRVIRECEAYVYTEASSGNQVTLRQYELECLCGKTIKRRVGDLCHIILQKGIVCCPECRSILTVRPDKPSRPRPKKPPSVRRSRITFKLGDIVEGARVLEECPSVQGEVQRYYLECACGKRIQRTANRIINAIKVGIPIVCFKCRGQLTQEHNSKIFDDTHFEPGEIIGGAEVIQEELRIKKARPYKIYALKCECGITIWRSVGHLLRASKKGSRVACFCCRNPNLIAPSPRFELGDTIGGSVVTRECEYGGYKRKTIIGFELLCPCGRLTHRTGENLRKAIKYGSIVRCRSCTSSASICSYYSIRNKARNERIRKSLADRFCRYGTIWSVKTLQRITEDIADEVGIELNTEVPHKDFFLLYDGEPLIASSLWPHSDTDSKD
jgi:hypothetical protein